MVTALFQDEPDSILSQPASWTANTKRGKVVVCAFERSFQLCTKSSDSFIVGSLSRVNIKREPNIGSLIKRQFYHLFEAYLSDSPLKSQEHLALEVILFLQDSNKI